MKSLRSAGTLLVVFSGLCGLMAYECYRRAEQAARAVADAIEGIEFESVAIPVESKVGGFACVMLLVAGVCCLLNARRDGETIPSIPPQQK